MCIVRCSESLFYIVSVCCVLLAWGSSLWRWRIGTGARPDGQREHGGGGLRRSARALADGDGAAGRCRACGWHDARTLRSLSAQRFVRNRQNREVLCASIRTSSLSRALQKFYGRLGSGGAQIRRLPFTWYTPLSSPHPSACCSSHGLQADAWKLILFGRAGDARCPSFAAQGELRRRSVCGRVQ